MSLRGDPGRYRNRSTLLPPHLDTEDLAGPWKARVAKTDDPKQLGRIQVVIPELTGDAVLPLWVWPSAAPCSGFHADGAAGAALFVPPVGAWVRVDFEGSVEGAHWMPGWNLDGKVPDVLTTHYPKRRGLVSPSGHYLYLDDSDGSDGDAVLGHRDGAAVALRGDGNVDVLSKDTPGKVVRINGGDHPLPKFDTFEGDLKQLILDIGTELLKGTSGNPAVQSLVGMATITAKITAFVANIEAGKYNSAKGRNG